jgi:hypothetical protein
MATPTEDRDAINQLMALYCHHIDAQEGEEWASLFVDNGHFQVGALQVDGHQALREFAEGLRVIYQTRPLRHIVANVVVEVDGDTATSRSYLFTINPGPKNYIGMTGTYRDTLLRVDGSWRFVSRLAESDMPLPLSAPDRPAPS